MTLAHLRLFVPSNLVGKQGRSAAEDRRVPPIFVVYVLAEPIARANPADVFCARSHAGPTRDTVPPQPRGDGVIDDLAH